MSADLRPHAISPDDVSAPKPFVLAENPGVAVALLAVGASLVVAVVAGQTAGSQVAGIIVGSALAQWSGRALAGGQR